jgi:hypothetical protein
VRREPRGTGLLRGLSGLLTGGLVVLAVALAIAWFVARQRGVPGPSGLTLAGHAAAAVAAVVLQRWADRVRGARAAAAALAVAAITAVVLAVQWLA